MPPPRRPPLGPPQLTKASGPRPRNTLHPKRSGTAPPPPILTPGSCSSPDMRAIPAVSPARDITDSSPSRANWESPSRQSDSAMDRDEDSTRNKKPFKLVGYQIALFPVSGDSPWDSIRTEPSQAHIPVISGPLRYSSHIHCIYKVRSLKSSTENILLRSICVKL